MHPNGQFLIVTNNSALATTNNVAVYSIGGTGLLTLAGSATAGVTPSGVTLDPTGSYVYVSNTGSASISRFAFNQTTGELTSPAPNTFATGSLPRFLFSCLTPQ